MGNDEQTRTSQDQPHWWLPAAVGGVVVLWFLIGWLLPRLIFGEWTDSGTFGDAFGVANALFAGLAFAGVLIAIDLQRRDLAETKKEMAEQTEAFQNQVHAASRQRFDSTYFQMLRLHEDIVNGISTGAFGARDRREGRTALTYLYSLCLTHFDRTVDTRPGSLPAKTYLDAIADAYGVWLNDYRDVVGHYFRNLYRIVKLVDDSKLIGDTSRREYIGILRAQLSASELGLVFYNMLGPGREKFQPLILKYDLLKNLPRSTLRPHHAEVALSSIRGLKLAD